MRKVKRMSATLLCCAIAGFMLARIRYLDNGDNHLMHSNGDDWFNWYKWHINFWGTKWNTDRPCVDNGIVVFDTAWSPCTPVIDKLAELFPECDFEYKYAESGSDFSGKRIYKKGECVKDYNGVYGEYYGEILEEDYCDD